MALLSICRIRHQLLKMQKIDWLDDMAIETCFQRATPVFIR